MFSVLFKVSQLSLHALAMWIATSAVLLALLGSPRTAEAAPAMVGPSDEPLENYGEDEVLRDYINWMRLRGADSLYGGDSEGPSVPFKRARFHPRLGKRSRNFYARLGKLSFATASV